MLLLKMISKAIDLECRFTGIGYMINVESCETGAEQRPGYEEIGDWYGARRRM